MGGFEGRKRREKICDYIIISNKKIIWLIKKEKHENVYRTKNMKVVKVQASCFTSYLQLV